MNVFEFAMQMEKDGESFYREIAAKTGDVGLRKIFSALADEEAVHFATFKSLSEKVPAKVAESNVLEKARNIFAEMQASGGWDITADTPQTDAYRKAMDAEKKAYTFYEQKAAEASDPAEAKILRTFAREERRHYRLLENVLEFVSRPQEWLENAEFARLDEY